MLDKSKTISIDNINYEVFTFKYYSGIYNGEDYFVLLDDFNIEGKHCHLGELYIIVPSYIEYQDIFQLGSWQNAMTRQYEINPDKIKMAKLMVLCLKIIDNENKVYLPSEDLFNNISIDFGTYILEKIEYVINKYYSGSSLSDERVAQLELACFNFYKAVEKRKHGQNVVVPPAPGVVNLLNVCEMFNCTPDKARKISKRDIDMISIARQQKNICETMPERIGL